jgi:hypothetical protein
MPLVQLTFTLATPDALLLLLTAATLLFTDRALHERRTSDWIAAGACAGLGMATHYRFVLVAASLLAYLVLTRAGRRQWRRPGAWWAAGLTLAGCLPGLLFNLRVDFAPLAYQFAGRHGESSGPRGWASHVAEQALVVTPLLLFVLMLALVEAWRRARAGDERARLLAYVATASAAVYFLASAVSDQSHDHVHWPQAGYVPLLVYAPDVLRRWKARGSLGRLAAVLTPTLAGLVLIASVVDMRTGAFGLIPRRPFLGWSELAQNVDAQREAVAGRQPVLVADSYIAAAQLAFHVGGTVDTYVLDHPVNARHGRALQFALWGLDEASLAARAGEDALVILDRNETKRRETPSWEERVRSHFERAVWVGRVNARVRRFDLLMARGVREPAGTAAPP